jgi:hypothetical protein
MPCPGYQPEKQCDQSPVGPGDLRPHALAELALQNGKLMLEKQDLRSTPGDIPAREPSRSEHARGQEEDETQTHKPRSSRIDHEPRNPMTSVNRLIGTLSLRFEVVGIDS